MSKRNQLTFEPLESRHLLSGSASLSHFLSSQAVTLPVMSSTPQPAALPDAIQTVSAPTISLRQYIPSLSSDAVTARWDWLAQTVWYVPTANMLAYATNSQLSGHLPIADQTLWYIDQVSNGQIEGESVTQLSINSSPTHASFTGVVTDGGQIRIEFSPASPGGAPTIGIGQMRFVDGAWRAEMQMATGTDTLVTHWAYMSELTPGGTPPDPSTTPPDGSLLADNWSWLQGTHWAIADTALLGSASAGAFTINGFTNGYFWGSGTSGDAQPFNVFGSVTPEGNLLLMVSVNGAPPGVQTGILRQTSTGGAMTLRTYEGQPALGSAWTLAFTTPPTNLKSWLYADGSAR